VTVLVLVVASLLMGLAVALGLYSILVLWRESVGQ